MENKDLIKRYIKDMKKESLKTDAYIIAKKAELKKEIVVDSNGIEIVFEEKYGNYEYYYDKKCEHCEKTIDKCNKQRCFLGRQRCEKCFLLPNKCRCAMEEHFRGLGYGF